MESQDKGGNLGEHGQRRLLLSWSHELKDLGKEGGLGFGEPTTLKRGEGWGKCGLCILGAKEGRVCGQVGSREEMAGVSGPWHCMAVLWAVCRTGV
jgi:hypothetical protein